MKKRQNKHITLGLGILFFSLNIFATEESNTNSINSVAEEELPIFFAVGGPPVGFEELEEGQKVIIDVYFGGRFLSTHLVTVTPETIILHRPENIVSLIGDLKEEEIIIQALSGVLDTNSHATCSIDSNNTNCGTIKPLVAGVIYDEEKFRLDIFINRNFMLTRDAEVKKFLTPSTVEDLSLVQNFGGTWSGYVGDITETDYTLLSDSRVAWSEHSIRMNTDYSKTQSFNVNDLYYEYDFEGQNVRGGLLSTEGIGLTFTQDRTIVGARIGTSYNTRLDLHFSSGTPITVFLPTRGIVEIRRDGRLLVSYMQDAGSQQLDTSSLPSGAYNIDIRILDESGQQLSRETRFFSKSLRLPPSDEWVYFLEGGQVLNRRQSDSGIHSERTDQYLLRGGLSHRLTENAALTFSAAIDRDDLLNEISLFHLSDKYEITPAIAFADDGSFGYSVDLQYYFTENINTYLYHRQLESNKNQFSISDINNPSLIGTSYKQSNAGITLPLSKGVASYNYSLVDSRTGIETETQSVMYSTNLYRNNDYEIDTNVSYSTSNYTDIAQVNFEFRLKDDKWTYRAKPLYRVYSIQRSKW